MTTEILSTVNFSHTKFARLLPAARSVLYFACGVPRVIFDYSSHTGLTQSWSATYNTLSRLAKQDAAELVTLGRDLDRWGVTRTDNIQEFEKEWELRLGRESKMKIGMAATYAEVWDFNPAAADLEDRLERLRRNDRASLSMDKLVDLIDFEHSEVALELQWVQVLVNHVPAFAAYKPRVVDLFKTVGAKMIVPPRKTRLHSLAPAAKNETIMTDLRDALLDFMKQLGQRDDDFTPRLMPIGGDGLTFEKLVQLKNLAQFQQNELRRFDLVYPFLETWHTQWTFLNLIFETHWGKTLSPNPAALGHSAVKINQKKPPNLKKVDYYPGLYLAYVVLDARMLDCWR